MRRSLKIELFAAGWMAAAVLCMAEGSPGGMAKSAGAGDGSSNRADMRQAALQTGDAPAPVELLKTWTPVVEPGAESAIAETTASLQYFGGPVVSNVVTVSVLWGPNVDATVAAAMPGFLRDVTNSAYMDWLCEYNTLGRSGATTNQVIGRGSFAGQFTISPQHTATTVTDADIQNEITYQLEQGNLPPPQYDGQGYPESLYLIDFPPGVTIELPDGSRSCVVFCAYHGTMLFNQRPLMYSIQPDFSGACAGGCGSGSVLQNEESAHSHQLVEVVTDPEVGLPDPLLGWYDNSNGEIGDICNSQQATLGVNGHSYTVQKEWSNRQNNCVTGGVQMASAPTISGPSSVPAGGTLTLTATGGTAPYEWDFDPGTGEQVISGQTSATLTLSPVAPSDSGTFYVFSKGNCSAESAPWAVRVCPVIVLAPSQLPGPVPGVAYSQAISASGGTAPYTYAVTAGALPPGLALSTGGVLSGTPTSGASASFTVTATDARGCVGERAYTLQAVAPPVIAGMKKVAPPFKIVVTGSNLQNGIKVFINGTQWSTVLWKKTTKVLLTGGKALKGTVPKGTPTDFTFVNPDGGTAILSRWSW